MRIMATEAAREPRPAMGLPAREITPPKAPKIPKTISIPVRKPEIRLSGTPLRAVFLMRLMVRMTDTSRAMNSPKTAATIASRNPTTLAAATTLPAP